MSVDPPRRPEPRVVQLVPAQPNTCDAEDQPILDVLLPPIAATPRLGRRRRLVRAIAITALCGLLVLTAYLLARPRGATDAQSRAAHLGDLRLYMLPAPPDSSTVPGAPGSNGHLSLAQDVAPSPNPSGAEANLRRYHFQEGAIRTWATVDGTLVVIRLLRFASDADGLGFYQHIEGPGMNQYRPNVHAVPRVNGSAVVGENQTPTADGFLNSYGVAVQGNVVMALVVGHVARRPRTSLTNWSSSSTNDCNEATGVPLAVGVRPPWLADHVHRIRPLPRPASPAPTIR
jgi:hypothetical protein